MSLVLWQGCIIKRLLPKAGRKPPPFMDQIRCWGFFLQNLPWWIYVGYSLSFSDMEIVTSFVSAGCKWKAWTKQHMSYGTAWLADPPHAGMGQACHWQLNDSPSHQKPILTHCQRFLSQMLYLISFFLPMMYHWSNMTIAGPVPVRGYTPLFFKLSDRVIDSKKDLVNVSQNVNL